LLSGERHFSTVRHARPSARGAGRRSGTSSHAKTIAQHPPRAWCVASRANLRADGREGSTMRGRLSVVAGTVLGVTVAASTAMADVTGSFDGSLVATPLASTPGAAVFSQTGRAVIGTIALPADLPTFGGAYLVH